MQDNPITPVPVHSSHTSPSTHVRRPKLRLRLEDLFPPLSPPTRRRWLTVTAVILVGIGAAGLFLWLRSANPPTGGGDQPTGIPAQTTENESRTDGEDTTLPLTDESEREVTDTTEPEDETSEDTTAEHTDVPDETVGDPPADTSSPTDSSPAEDTSSPTDTTPEDTVPTVPEGCLGYASLDMSESALGMGYIQNGGISLPSSLPVSSPWLICSRSNASDS